MSPAVDFGFTHHPSTTMLSALLKGEVGSWTGVAWCEHVAIQVPWRWWSPRAWRHQYRWPGGSDAWYPYVDVDGLEDPAYDRLYDGFGPEEPDHYSDVVKRWAARLWVELPREIYFNRFLQGSNPRVSSAIAAIRKPWWKRAWSRLWLHEEREAMWRAKFERDYPRPDQGGTIKFDLIRKLETPDAQGPKRVRRRHDRPQSLRPRGRPRKRPGL